MERQVDISFSALTGKELRVKIVDVGANPIDDSPPYTAMLLAGEADIVGFEPNPQAMAALEKAKGPNETYLPQAVGDGGRHMLHICQAPGMTSLFPPNPEILNLFHGFPEWGQVISNVAVQTVRLDDVPATEGADLLKLDVQGAELMVLSHAGTRLQDALIIQAEVEFLPMYIGQPLFSEVEAFLRGKGFLFHRFYQQTSRVIRPLLVNHDIYAGMSQLFWADAVFIRDITRLDALSHHALLKMAKILHDCYRSLDVVVYLLTEYDRRTGEQLALAYTSQLHHMISGKSRGGPRLFKAGYGPNPINRRSLPKRRDIVELSRRAPLRYNAEPRWPNCRDCRLRTRRCVSNCCSAVWMQRSMSNSRKMPALSAWK